MTETPPNIIEELVSTQTDWFELNILGCVFKDKEFRTLVLSALCVDATTGKYVGDFSTKTDNALYGVLKEWLSITGSPEIDAPSVEHVEAVLSGFAAVGRLMAYSEIPLAVERYKHVLATDPESKTLVKPGFEFWIKRQRAARIYREHTSKRNWDAGELSAAVLTQTKSLEVISNEDVLHPFGKALTTVKIPVETVDMHTLTTLRNMLGGGATKGESTLFIAPQGGGKSVMACQIASSLAGYSGQRGLLVFTEQNAEAYETRILSNLCSIEFEKISHGVVWDKLTGPQKEKYETVMARLKDKLFLENWNNNSKGRSIEADLIDLVKRRSDQIGAPIDFLVFDWIGGGLGKLQVADAQRIRFIYKLAADTLGRISEELNIATFAFAQAAPGKSLNKPKLTSEDIAEHKGMGETFFNIISISCMMAGAEPDKGKQDPNENAEDYEAAYDKLQFLHCSKARRGKTGTRKIIRDFAYQRFQDYITRKPNG